MPVTAVASALFVISLTCEIAAAADPGFYIAGAGGRTEQRLDKQAGVGPPVAVFAVLPPGGGFFYPFPIYADPPPFSRPPPATTPAPPVFGIIGSVVPLLGPDITVDETDVGWSFALGYRVNKYLAAELSFVDAGEASLTERYTGPASLAVPLPDLVRSYTVSSRGPALSVLGSLPLGERWEVFLRGGVLFTRQEVESRTFGGPLFESDYSDEVATIGAGVQWTFLPRWSARLEYQRSDDIQPNEAMGESRLDQASLSVLYGL